MVLRRRKSVDKELLRESRHGSYSPPPSAEATGVLDHWVSGLRDGWAA